MPQQTTHGPAKSGGGTRMRVRKRGSLEGRRATDVAETASTPLRSALDALGGVHVCSLYEARQDCPEILKAFLEVGIARGEKCLCLVSGGSEKSLREMMRAASPRIHRAVGSRVVDLTTIERAYFTHRGPLTQRTLDFWRKAGEQAAAEGFSGLRGVVQADGVLGGPAVLARWMEYENSLTQVLAESGGTLLCMYNRSALPSEFVRDALQALAIVAHRGRIANNTFHVPPEEYAAPDKAQREVQRMLLSLGGRRSREVVSRPLAAKTNRRLREAQRTVKACESL
ncbi:MAG: multi-sensor signal transduction histidine kinase, partial [Gammaproteobacteria bacterium]|nr:multi-sensor signal transduction histidine kinase [Gammaproteobacteria bacterium]